MAQSSMHLSALFIYPVKSLRGCSVTTCGVDALGLVGDRRFLVVDEKGSFLTQRAVPKMALIDTALSGSRLTLSFRGHGVMDVSTEPDSTAPILNVSVWRSSGLQAEDCGDAAARWLSAALATPCRLVRIGERFCRPVVKSAQDMVSFADAYPFLLLGESSVSDLNDRLAAQGAETLSIDRFRPNLVFSGGEAYAEDRWTRFRVGEVTFRTSGPCARCVITTIDPQTAERGVEPLRTLAGYRRNPADPSEVCFGQNAVHEIKSGTLRLGDAVELLD